MSEKKKRFNHEPRGYSFAFQYEVCHLYLIEKAVRKYVGTFVRSFGWLDGWSVGSSVGRTVGR